MSKKKKMRLMAQAKDLLLSGLTLAGGIGCIVLGVRLSVL